MIRPRPSLLLFALLVVCLAACGRSAQESEAEARRAAGSAARKGGTLRVAIPDSRVSLNPLQGPQPFQIRLWDALYPRLFRVEPKGARPPEFVADLARSYYWDAAASHLTVRMRNDRVWEDTTRVQPEDVVATYRAYLDAGLLPEWRSTASASPGARTAGVLSRPARSSARPGALVSVEALGDSAVRFAFRPEVASWLALEAASLPVLPSAWLAKRSVGAGGETLWPSRLPASGGPFLLPAVPSGHVLTLRPNPLATSAQRPYLERVLFEACPGEDARILRLSLGRADVVFDVLPFRLERLLSIAQEVRGAAADDAVESAPRLVPSAVESVELMALNWTAEGFSPALREALSLAVDRPRLVRDLFAYRGRNYAGIAAGFAEPAGPPPDATASGSATGADSLARAEAARFDSLLSGSGPPRFDPARAESLLSTVGLVDRDGDGYRGFARFAAPSDSVFGDVSETPFRLRLLYARGDDLHERLALALEEDLFRVGVRLEPEPVEPEALYDRFREGSFQAALLGFRPGRTPDLSSLWASWGRWNGMGYASPEVDELIGRVERSSDPIVVERAVREIEARIRRDRPAVFLVYRERLDLAGPTVRGLEHRAGEDLPRLERVWLADSSEARPPKGIASR